MNADHKAFIERVAELLPVLEAGEAMAKREAWMEELAKLRAERDCREGENSP
jgi:hypothetical protein